MLSISWNADQRVVAHSREVTSSHNLRRAALESPEMRLVLGDIALAMHAVP